MQKSEEKYRKKKNMFTVAIINCGHYYNVEKTGNNLSAQQ